MKIYVLGQHDYEGLDIDAIYSTKEKALAALPYHEYLDDSDIHEFDLDPEHVGEPYETYYYCNFDPNAQDQKIWGGTRKKKPCDFLPFEFVDHYQGSLTHTQGWGKTHEEAEVNARHAQTLIHPVWQVWADDKNKNDHRRRLPHPSLVSAWAGSLCTRPYAVHEDFNVAKIAVMEYQATGKLSPYLTVPK